MPSDSGERRRELLVLAADGCLISAGAFGLMMGSAFGLDWLGVAPLSEPGGSGIDLLLSTFSWLLQIGGMFVGPVLVWLLYRRRFDKGAVLGALVGFGLGGAAIFPVAMLGAALDWLVGLVTDVEYAGLIGYLGLIVAAFVALLVWLDIRAVRDLSSARENVPLAISRFVATLAVIGFAWGVTVAVVAGEGPDAGVFMLAAGLGGAIVVTMAELGSRYLQRQTDAQTTVVHT